MHIRLLKPLIRDSKQLQADAVINVSDDMGKALIGSGNAEQTDARVSAAPKDSSTSDSKK
jgi:hypothetical protein